MVINVASNSGQGGDLFKVIEHGGDMKVAGTKCEVDTLKGFCHLGGSYSEMEPM